MSKITVYSQNISSDKRSEDLPKFLGEEFTFAQRFQKIVKNFEQKEKFDVIGFNEIRYKDRVDLVKEQLEELGYDVYIFPNNYESDMAFRNVIAIFKNSAWKIEDKKKDIQHQWVAYADEKSFMSTEFALIEGDPHGRCAGIVYLYHKDFPERKVCVVVSHVVPFGEVKKRQQNALFSINQANLKDFNIPTVFVGDFNRFPEDEEVFKDQLESYGVAESVPTKLVIPGPIDKVFTDPDDIGTFTPWPNDDVYQEKKSKPMKDSRLNIHAYTKSTKDQKLISVDETFVRACMIKDLDENPKFPEENFNPVRFLLDCKMASDHIPIISTFTIHDRVKKNICNVA